MFNKEGNNSGISEYNNAKCFAEWQAGEGEGDAIQVDIRLT